MITLYVHIIPPLQVIDKPRVCTAPFYFSICIIGMLIIRVWGGEHGCWGAGGTVWALQQCMGASRPSRARETWPRR